MSVLYHVTERERLQAVLAQGLRVGSERHLTVEGVWANEVYGEQPVYLALKPWLLAAESNVLLAVESAGLELVADLPSLLDCGAYLEEDGGGLFWEEGETPEELLPHEDPLSAAISFQALLHDPEVRAAAIALTGTCAVLTSVPPERITLVTSAAGR